MALNALGPSVECLVIQLLMSAATDPEEAVASYVRGMEPTSLSPHDRKAKNKVVSAASNL